MTEITAALPAVRAKRRKKRVTQHQPDKHQHVDATSARATAEAVDGPAEGTMSRRTWLRSTGRLLVYTAPLIQLYRPTEALAGSGLSPTS